MPLRGGNGGTERLLLGFHRKFLVHAVGARVSKWLGGDGRLRPERRMFEKKRKKEREKRINSALHFLQKFRWPHAASLYAGEEASQ